jgi:hypothetical protein
MCVCVWVGGMSTWGQKDDPAGSTKKLPLYPAKHEALFTCGATSFARWWWSGGGGGGDTSKTRGWQQRVCTSQGEEVDGGERDGSCDAADAEWGVEVFEGEKMRETTPLK